MEGQSVLESCLWRRLSPSQEYLISSSVEDEFNLFYYKALRFENLSVNKFLFLSEQLVSYLRVELLMASPPQSCWRIKRTDVWRPLSRCPAHSTCSGNAVVSVIKTLQMFVIQVRRETRGDKRGCLGGDSLEGADAGERLNWSAIAYKPLAEIYLRRGGVSLFIALIFQQFA